MKITDFFVPTAKQREVLKYIGKGYVIFYGGAKGGGKTDLSIFASVVAVLQYPNLKVCLIRRTYPELEREIIDRFLTVYPPHVFRYKYNDRKKIAKFPNGSSITFQSINKYKDTQKIVEYQMIVIDEVQNFSENIIRRCDMALRTSRHPSFHPTLLMCGNPLGESDVYLRTHFVHVDYNFWNEEELKQKDKFVFIPAYVWDNPHISEEYIERLKRQPSHFRDAYLYGKFDISEDMFFDMWNPDVHVVDDFEIPSHWVRKAGLDLGWSQSHPTVCIWVAQDPDTNDLYAYREYVQYGTTLQYAREIMELEANDGFVQTFADPSIFRKARPQENIFETEAMLFQSAGKYLFPAVNDRAMGWRILKNWLAWDDNTPPKLRFFRNACRYTITTIPQQKYSQTNNKRNDLDTTGPDDAVDALRYVVVSGFFYPTNNEAEEETKNTNSRRYGIPREEQVNDLIYTTTNKAVYL